MTSITSSKTFDRRSWTVAAMRSRLRRTPSDAARQPSPYLRMVAIFVVVLAAYALLLHEAKPQPTGDEPHYLLIAESIVHDGDLDLSNNYRNEKQLRESYPQGGVLDPLSHAAQYREGGGLSPIHSAGLPLILAPLRLLGQGWIAARVLMAVLAALCAPLMLLIIDRLYARRRATGFIAVLVSSLTAPIFFFSNQIYPDIPGAFLVVASMSLLICGKSKRAMSAAASVASLLPWFHVRFALFTAVLLATAAVKAWSLIPDQRARRAAPTTALLIIGPAALSGLCLAILNYNLYGSISPNAAYRSPPYPAALPFKVANIYRWTVGDWLSPQWGVVPLAPVLLVALAGVLGVVIRFRVWAIVGVVAVGAYYVVASAVALGGGYCPPGRWIVLFAPLLAIPLVEVITAGWRARFVFGVLATYSLIVSLAGAQNFGLLYPGTDSLRVPVADETQELWPLTSPSLPAGFQLQAAALNHNVGRVTSAQTVAATPQDGPGAVVWGLSPSVIVGAYEVQFAFPSVAGEPGSTAATVDLIEGDRQLASAPVLVPASGTGPALATLVAFTSGQDLQARVFAVGNAALEVSTITMTPVSPSSVDPPTARSSLPKALLWFGVLILLTLISTPHVVRRRRDPSLAGTGSHAPPTVDGLPAEEPGGVEESGADERARECAAEKDQSSE
jgi:hypothetical protein